MSEEQEQTPEKKVPSTVTKALKDLLDSARHRAMAPVNERKGDQTGALLDVLTADRLEQEGQQALTIPEGVEKQPSVGREMVLTRGSDPADRAINWYLNETLCEVTLVHVKASTERMELALEIGDGCLCNALDAAETIGAENSLEKMAAARLMTAYSNALGTLARLRNGGRQEVIVQHVNATSGGQAVVTGTVGPLAEAPPGETSPER